MIHALVKKIHMYIGLLNFSILLVFGIAGLNATFEASPEERARPSIADVRFEPYIVPPGLSDKAVADAVHQFLKLPLTTPIPAWAVRRDGENNLLLNFYTVNGMRRITVLEKENKLRVELFRNTTPRYLNALHTTTMARPPESDIRIRLWGYYNELAIWSLMAMAISGVYLWLSSRPWYRPAQIAFAGGSGLFVLLYMMTR